MSWELLFKALQPLLTGDAKAQPPQQASAQNPSGSMIPWNPDMTPSSGVPSADVLQKAPLGSFRELREKYPSQSDQNFIAPFEHRAYVREFGSNIPEKLILGAVLPAGYNIGKSIGAVRGRSQPSWKEWSESLKGAFDETPK